MATPSRQELETYARAAARRYGVPEEMFVWQIGRESGWDVNARNPNSSAKGLGQFIDGTEKWMGINAMDPYQALDGAAKYDALLYKQEGDWGKALEKYGTLHGASPKTQAEFNKAMGEENVSVTDKILNAFKNPYGVYEAIGTGAMNLVENAASVTTGSDQTGIIKKGFTAVTANIGLVVLGIVVIALAILSNNTVQGVAKKAILKR